MLHTYKFFIWNECTFPISVFTKSTAVYISTINVGPPVIYIHICTFTLTAEVKVYF